MSKILLSYLHYPVSIARYFKYALRKQGHEVFSVGPYKASIPWAAEMDFSDYLDVPDMPLPDAPAFPADMAVSLSPWKPDLVLSIDAGFYLLKNSQGIKQALVMTDPHAIDYHDRLQHFDYAFCMQRFYQETLYKTPPPTMWHLPYAFSPDHHFWKGQDLAARPFDVCLVSGLLYDQRIRALQAMEEAGLRILWAKGALMEQASEYYNDAVVAFNWSSKEDLPARFFEGLAMRSLVITNRVPDLQTVGDLKEGEHYIAYDTVDELVEKAVYYTRPEHIAEAWNIASRGWAQVQAGNHTYGQRGKTILDVCEVRP